MSTAQHPEPEEIDLERPPRDRSMEELRRLGLVRPARRPRASLPAPLKWPGSLSDTLMAMRNEEGE